MGSWLACSWVHSKCEQWRICSSEYQNPQRFIPSYPICHFLRGMISGRSEGYARWCKTEWWKSVLETVSTRNLYPVYASVLSTKNSNFCWGHIGQKFIQIALYLPHQHIRLRLAENEIVVCHQLHASNPVSARRYVPATAYIFLHWTFIRSWTVMVLSCRY